MMAKIAIAYLRLGLSFDQIGFIKSPFLDAQKSVLFCLFRHHFNLTDDELKKLSIGREINFLFKKWQHKEVIIRSTPCPLEQKFLGEEKDKQINRFAIWLCHLSALLLNFTNHLTSY